MTAELTYTILKQEECADCNLIVFLDTSTYPTPPTSPILRIYPPDFCEYVNINYNPEAITLIRPENIKHSCLPAGLYRIIQSICPNSETEVESCFLHVCPIRQEIIALGCEEEGLTDLLFELEIAQGLVEECTDKAMEIFNIVKTKLEKLKC